MLIIILIKKIVKAKTPLGGNAVHLRGTVLRFSGSRGFDILTALGLDGRGVLL